MKKKILDKCFKLLAFVWNQQGIVKAEQAVDGYIIKVYHITNNLVRMDILRRR